MTRTLLKVVPAASLATFAIIVALLPVLTVATRAAAADDDDNPLEYDGGGGGAEFSPDGSKIIAYGDASGAVILDAKTAKPLTPPMAHGLSQKYLGGKYLRSAHFGPDGKKLVTTGADQETRVWDSGAGKLLLTLHMDDTPLGAVFSSDGRKIVTASAKSAQIWDAETGEKLLAPLMHEDNVRWARCTPDGHRVLTYTTSGVAVLWDAASGKQVRKFGDDSSASCAAVSVDGTKVVMAGIVQQNGLPLSFGANIARIWDLDTGKLLVTTPVWDDRDPDAIAFSPDGKQFAVAARGARVWDAITGKPVTDWLRDDFDQRTHGVAFSPDSKWILRVGECSEAVVVDVATRKTVLNANSDSAMSAAFSPDGKRLVVSCHFDHKTCIWTLPP